MPLDVESDTYHVERDTDHVESDPDYVESDRDHVEGDTDHVESDNNHAESDTNHVELRVDAAPVSPLANVTVDGLVLRDDVTEHLRAGFRRRATQLVEVRHELVDEPESGRLLPGQLAVILQQTATARRNTATNSDSSP